MLHFTETKTTYQADVMSVNFVKRLSTEQFQCCILSTKQHAKINILLTAVIDISAPRSLLCTDDLDKHKKLKETSTKSHVSV